VIVRALKQVHMCVCVCEPTWHSVAHLVIIVFMFQVFRKTRRKKNIQLTTISKERKLARAEQINWKKKEKQ
jgi:hypothetical protein